MADILSFFKRKSSKVDSTADDLLASLKSLAIVSDDVSVETFHDGDSRLDVISVNGYTASYSAFLRDVVPMNSRGNASVYTNVLELNKVLAKVTCIENWFDHIDNSIKDARKQPTTISPVNMIKLRKYLK